MNIYLLGVYNIVWHLDVLQWGWIKLEHLEVMCVILLSWDLPFDAMKIFPRPFVQTPIRYYG